MRLYKTKGILFEKISIKDIDDVFAVFEIEYCGFYRYGLERDWYYIDIDYDIKVKGYVFDMRMEIILYNRDILLNELIY
jgi:hypothetical protein